MPKTPMENTIRKNERVQLHLLPGIAKQFPVTAGIDYYHDELHVVYPQKYEGRRIYLTYKDASGSKNGGYITLDGGGEKVIAGKAEVTIPIFGFIEFTGTEELFAEFSVQQTEPI